VHGHGDLTHLRHIQDAGKVQQGLFVDLLETGHIDDNRVEPNPIRGQSIRLNGPMSDRRTQASGVMKQAIMG
jgi:hypothetical protein